MFNDTQTRKAATICFVLHFISSDRSVTAKFTGLIFSHISYFHVYLLTCFFGYDFCFWKPTPGDVNYQPSKPMTSSSGPIPQWRHDRQERQVRGTVPVKFLPPAFTRISRSEKASNKFCCLESLQSPCLIFSEREENITRYYCMCVLT